MLDGRINNGGKRKGAGRKKSSVQRKARDFRLTDEEWEAVKDFLTSFRILKKATDSMQKEEFK